MLFSSVGPALGSSSLERLAWAILEKYRAIRKHLDPYAVPRLIIPSGWWKDQRVELELLAQLALIAAKEVVLKLSDKAALLFREYCSGVTSYYLNRLEEEDKNAVIDRVFERLYLKGRPGRGIMALNRAYSFRPYIKEAIRGEVANVHKATKVSRRSGTGPPGSIAEAAEILEVPFSTVWRRMRKLGFEHWTPEAWNEIHEDFQTKKQWRLVYKVLRKKRLSHEAARKRIYRWKKEGMRIVDVLRLLGLA